MSFEPKSAEVLTRAMSQLGWRTTGSFRDSIEYWEPTDLSARSGLPDEILIPVNEAAADYQSLLRRATQALFSAYGPQLDSLTQSITLMLERNLSEVLVRRATPDLSGMIAWADGNAMIQGTREMLIAAAKATSRPRRRYANAEAVIAEEYLAACRMGQTQIGSYVVSALTPDAGAFPVSRSEKKSRKKTPVFEGRDITNRLMLALDASVEAIQASRDGELQTSAFEDRVPQGVSFELMRALKQIVSTAVESSISIEIQPTQTLFESQPRRIREYAFKPADASVLRKAAAYFESSPAPLATSISGEVVLLKNSAYGEERKIKLIGRVAGKPRTVTVALTPAQYESALRAHTDELVLFVSGELELHSRSAIIQVADEVVVESAAIQKPRTSTAASAETLFG